MENSSTIYDAAIIGGGLAGLALSIQLAKKGYSVVLMEKEKYPFHKVCGEYISLESWDFLTSLGLPLQDLNVPVIEKLQLTAPDGTSFTTRLPLGGFGISRFLLDDTLAGIAVQHGVTLLQETKVTNTVFADDIFDIEFTDKTAFAQKLKARICAGTFGKRSNLDVKWKRPFIQKKSSRINNFIGVKYHIQTQWPAHIIGLHNFIGGYCGISKIEGNNYCLCYLTTANELKKYGGSVETLQQQSLYKNLYLKSIFTHSTIAEGFPVTISQISFDKKEQVQQHVLLMGDAAGMITPLCGNGMSMALHSSKIGFTLIDAFLQHKITRIELEDMYATQWAGTFSGRLHTGRILQRFFGSVYLSNAFVRTFNALPFLASAIIRKTHGTPF